MNSPFINLLAMALYLSVAYLLWRDLRRGARTAGAARLGIFTLAAGAVLLHGAILYSGFLRENALDLGLTNAISLVAWTMALTFLVTALSRPIESLGVLIMPVAAVTLLGEWLWPLGHQLIQNSTPLSSAHIVISLLAYSLLSVAVVQSLMLAWQERQLRSHQPSRFLQSLPPLETMESLMFGMIGLGFLLLTLTLVSGIFFSEEFGQALRFNHHIVLSMISWVVFAVLLIGRWRLGWRGRTALHWTWSGFALLVLAYFGTKFVLEVVLHR